MRLDPNPLFRRVITPWYDSPAVCWIVLLAMLAVIFFSWAGLWVALSNDAFRGHAWMPILILVLSLFVFWATFYRMLRRHSGK
jgi:hypothetical protein